MKGSLWPAEPSVAIRSDVSPPNGATELIYSVRCAISHFTINHNSVEASALQTHLFATHGVMSVPYIPEHKF